MKYELRAWALNMEHISDIYAMLLLPFLFSSDVDKRDIVSTPSAEKKPTKATATCQVCVKSVADETETCASNSLQNNILPYISNNLSYFNVECLCASVTAVQMSFSYHNSHVGQQWYTYTNNWSAGTQREKKFQKCARFSTQLPFQRYNIFREKMVCRNQLWHKRCIK